MPIVRLIYRRVCDDAPQLWKDGKNRIVADDFLAWSTPARAAGKPGQSESLKGRSVKTIFAMKFYNGIYIREYPLAGFELDDGDWALFWIPGNPDLDALMEYRIGKDFGHDCFMNCNLYVPGRLRISNLSDGEQQLTAGGKETDTLFLVWKKCEYFNKKIPVEVLYKIFDYIGERINLRFRREPRLYSKDDPVLDTLRQMVAEVTPEPPAPARGCVVT
eukprot:TRINITY_DN102935_c0_g1_i1.p1 TRINITY_DN102935_c0_g1~~TRINITY_DN102935_c0_g1_i1.p1  ORF type:complete len:218 (+),score=28.10 TRINITY_DN102935_c0_g1_i1:52-705(+)